MSGHKTTLTHPCRERLRPNNDEQVWTACVKSCSDVNSSLVFNGISWIENMTLQGLFGMRMDSFFIYFSQLSPCSKLCAPRSSEAAAALVVSRSSGLRSARTNKRHADSKIPLPS